MSKDQDRARHDRKQDDREMTPNEPRLAPDARPQSATPLEQTRDLAAAHLIERYADGETRPEEITRIQAEINATPGGPLRLEYERQLKAACARLLGQVPIEEDCRARVMEAVRLRLRGEADAIENQRLAHVDPCGTAESPSVLARLTFGRVAAAAALVLAGFLGARITSQYTGSRDFTTSSTASLTLSGRILSADYAMAVEQAREFLGSDIQLPIGPDIVPVRFEPGSAHQDRHVVTFEYTVRIPDTENAGKFRRVPVSVLIETGPIATDTAVRERAEGDVSWRTRSVGSLTYNVQSESKQAVATVCGLLGWPAPDESSR